MNIENITCGPGAMLSTEMSKSQFIETVGISINRN